MSVPLDDSNSLPVDGDAARYHAVCPWAVLALLLGILSPLAFVGPLLWLLPWFCIVVALLAIWKISSSAGALAGWNVALLGLLLALLFGIAAPTRTLTRHYWLETRAEHFANKFIDLLQRGQAYAAYQLTLHPTFRKPLDDDGSAENSKNPMAQEAYERFLQLEPPKTLLAQRDQAKVEELESTWFNTDENGDNVAVRFQITRRENAAKVPLVVQLTLLRFLDPKTDREKWMIRSADVVQ